MNYYNENDRKAAAWIRELIAEKLIPAGEVDERSILDVAPNDLRDFQQCHFFAGIGGWAYALRLAGVPDDAQVWTGSCPCQPFSCAGKGLGEADERHLWPYFRNLIAECRPPVVFGEQVASAAGREWIAGVRADLEAVAYAVGAADLCAAGIAAPHIRQRLYWVADAEHSAGRAERQLEPRQREVKGPPHTSERNGDNGGAANSNSPGRLRTRPAQPEKRHGDFVAVGRGESSGLVNPILAGPQGHAGNGDGGNKPGWNDAQPIGPVTAPGNANFWANSIWHGCRDGKTRRIPVEPGLFPLAPRLPGRVAILRGAGNSIVPELASEFIQAYLETLTQ